MASADVQILGTGSKAAPLDYVLPSGSELILKAVRADFDGTGAGSAFLPALEIISDAGHSVGVYPTDVAVAAGASASVSFAPFLRNAAASSALPSPVSAIYQSTVATIAPGGVATNMAWTFAGGTALFDLTTPTSPAALAHGVYWVGVSFRSNATWTAGRGLQAYLNYPFGEQAFAIADSNVRLPQGFVGGIAELTAGQSFSFGLANLDTANRDVYIQEADCVLLYTL